MLMNGIYLSINVKKVLYKTLHWLPTAIRPNN